VWPENWESFEIFSTLQTQWRSGFGGPTGLDYNTLYATMTLMNIDQKKQLDLLADIRVMEFAALTEIHRKKA
jgi:hypothetical protein